MENSLGGLFSLVNEWLRFAEAKNAACVAFNTAIISVSVGAIDGWDVKSIYFLFAFVLSVVSAGIGLVSFLPSLSIFRNLAAGVNRKPSENGNILFFGSIADMGVEAFRKRAATVFNVEESSSIFLPLTEQIFVNSVITKRKLSLFNASIFFAALGITCGLSIIIWAIMTKNKDIG